MGGIRWSEDELRLVRTNIPTKELAKVMDRSEGAINNKRWSLDISFCEGVFTPPIYTREEKMSRIYALANKLGVRIQ
jgi:hypothetical protein